MKNHLNIDLTTLKYTKLTDVIELVSVDLSEITMETGPEVVDLKVKRSIEAIVTGNVTALVYWFDLALGEGISVSTLDSRCHWKQASIMVKDKLKVNQGQTLTAKVILQNSCLDVEIEGSNVLYL